jgi:hypothetical protein
MIVKGLSTAHPSKMQELVPGLVAFFDDAHNFEVLRSINGTCPPFSLRALAWYVGAGLHGEEALVDYESNLRKYTRRRFDPFRRCNRIVLEYDGDSVVTTIGQMNFFRWMISSKVWSSLITNRARMAAEVARRTPVARQASVARCGQDHAGISAGLVHVSGRHVVIFD